MCVSLWRKQCFNTPLYNPCSNSFDIFTHKKNPKQMGDKFLSWDLCMSLTHDLITEADAVIIFTMRPFDNNAQPLCLRSLQRLMKYENTDEMQPVNVRTSLTDGKQKADGFLSKQKIKENQENSVTSDYMHDKNTEKYSLFSFFSDPEN